MELMQTHWIGKHSNMGYDFKSSRPFDLRWCQFKRSKPEGQVDTSTMINTSITMTGLLALNSQQPTPNHDFNSQYIPFRTTSLFAPDHNAKMKCVSTSYKRMARESYSIHGESISIWWWNRGPTPSAAKYADKVFLWSSWRLFEKNKSGWIEDRVLATWSIHWIWQMQAEKGSPTLKVEKSWCGACYWVMGWTQSIYSLSCLLHVKSGL